MNTKTSYVYAPDYALPPGETIQEILSSIGMTQAELAKRMGRPVEQVNRLVKGHIAIEPKTALQLERTLTMTASFWLNLDAQYQELKAREKDEEGLANAVEWVGDFPLNEMKRKGLISSSDKTPKTVRQVLDFFGVATPGQYKAIQDDYPIACRESQIFKRNEGAVSVWLRLGQREAMKHTLPPYNEKLFKQSLNDIRHFTVRPMKEAMTVIRKSFSAAGVVLLFVEELPDIRLSGAVQWFGGRPIIQFTNRHKKEDVIWFTLYHEAGHVILHPENEVFLEGSGERARFEEEADNYARNKLIDSSEYDRFVKAGSFELTDVVEFARSQGIAPGIVAGRLCFDLPEIRKNGGYAIYSKLRIPVDPEDLMPDEASEVRKVKLKKLTAGRLRRS